MALRKPLDLEPPPRPPWRSGLPDAEAGPMAEDLLAVTFTAAAGGLGTVSRPMVDIGIDFYLRRRRSLLTAPTQVKSFRELSPDGSGMLDIPVGALGHHPNGRLAIVHLPEPYDALYPRLFLIPFDEFRRLAPRVTRRGQAFLHFEANFANPGKSRWSPFAVDIEGIRAWLNAIPGWTDPVPPLPDMLAEIPDLETRPWRAEIGRLWAAAEIVRAAAKRPIAIAEDRIRLDPVTFLLHDMGKELIAGLHVRTGKITKTGSAPFNVKRRNFFIDDRLYVVLVPLDEDERPYEFCLLIPSADMPKLGFGGSITLRRKLTKRYVPYQVARGDFGAVFLSRVFGS